MPINTLVIVPSNIAPFKKFKKEGVLGAWEAGKDFRIATTTTHLSIRNIEYIKQNYDRLVIAYRESDKAENFEHIIIFEQEPVNLIDRYI
jgi:hypothetical protein